MEDDGSGVLMVEVWLPYGKTEVVVRIPAENLMMVVEPRGIDGVEDPDAEIKRALEHPVGGKGLDEIVGDGGRRIAIVVEDRKHPAPSRLMVSSLVEALGQFGVKDEDITIIIGYGIHADRGGEIPLFQEGSVGTMRLVDHDPAAQDLTMMGITSRRTEVHVNRAFAEADIRILTGCIHFHPFAGYSGGSMSILPGVAGLQTIRRNHSLLLDPRARAGNLEENPVHLEMAEAARLVGVDFVLNTVLNARGEVVRAIAGDLEQVFAEGVGVVDEMFKVEVDGLADVAIVSPGGHPFDADLCQALWGIDRVLDLVKEKGVVILVAECPDGYGSETFCDWVRRFKTLDMVEREVRLRYSLGGEAAYYLMKTCVRVKVIIVSVMPEYYSSAVFGLKTAETVNLALQSALRMVGKRGKVLVVPMGMTTLPVAKKHEG